MTSTEPELLLRPAEPDDRDQLADVYLTARRAAVPDMPAPVHSAEQIGDWMRARLGSDDEVWVAQQQGEVVGYARTTPGWLDDLYVVPSATGRGVGTALLELVKARQAAGFSLWVFASNTPARRFYARRGLVELEHTPGERNEEGVADLRLAWPGRDPIAYLRAQIDEVDEDLAWVVSRRAALTSAIQRYKRAQGNAARDPDREAQIARRLAARSGGTLDEQDWRRILDEVIAASLAAGAKVSGPD